LLPDLIIPIMFGEEYKLQSSSLRSFIQPPVISVQIFFWAPCSQTPSVYVPPLKRDTNFHSYTNLWAKL
jgi:hypothetical protein